MGKKDFEIEYNYCDCHPETCCCDAWNLTYKGEVLARNHNKGQLIKLMGLIRSTKITKPQTMTEAEQIEEVRKGRT